MEERSSRQIESFSCPHCTCTCAMDGVKVRDESSGVNAKEGPVCVKVKEEPVSVKVKEELNDVCVKDKRCFGVGDDSPH